MARETSPGLKILWVWTIGTAASTQLTHSLTHSAVCMHLD
ncbi:hypothetical protein WN944_019251 [Citrus x changshan-huyou]|uniref:Uncharacterized protein n=1 Tax=Citrus x changshan-huyou TaxID=2935761 RepID=A0AAP0LUW8_9ROSI